MPKDSIFSENKKEAKARVALTLKNNAELAKTSAAEIKGFVAGAVLGLHTYNVSIVVSSGQQGGVNAKDKDGVTPLHVAVQDGHKDVVELLRQHGGHE